MCVYVMFVGLCCVCWLRCVFVLFCVVVFVLCMRLFWFVLVVDVCGCVDLLMCMLLLCLRCCVESVCMVCVCV